MKREWQVSAWTKYQKKEAEPTGRFIAIRKEALNVPPTPVAFVEPETMNEILLQFQMSEEGDSSYVH